MNRYAVIQTRFEKIDVATLLQVLTQQGRIPHADARRAVRRMRGILWERFDRSAADAVCNELTRRDFGVRVVEHDQIPELPEPKTIRWFELDKERIEVPEGIRGDTIPMDWLSVFVVSVGQIAKVEKKKFHGRRQPNTMFSKGAAFFSSDGSQSQKRGKLVDVVDVIGVDQAGGMRYLRLPSDELAYNRIMGNETELGRFDRFLAIVDFLVAHATEAIISPETRKLLLRRDPSGRVVEGDGAELIQEASIATYNRWLLNQAINREIKIQDSVSDDPKL